MMVTMDSPSTNIDLIVLGAGAGGMAAVAAAEGLKVLVLEKAAQVGGTTAISGGMIWAPNNHLANSPDSLEKAETYLDAAVPTDAGRSQRHTFLELSVVI
jgi:succinate dehydrogenase/fumarate reductase flavoprotein subunit